MILLSIYLTTALILALGIESGGEYILRKFSFPDTIPRVFHWGAGTILFTWILIFLGIIGFYVPWVMWIVWFGLLLLSIPCLIREVRRYRKYYLTKKQPDGSILYSVTQILVLVLLIVCFASVLTPETRHDPYDYHLTIPTLYLANHGITEIPWHVFTYMPKNGEILYGWALGIENDSIAKMIHFGFGILCLVAIWSFMSRIVNQEVGWFAIGLASTLPVFAFVATSSYIDLIRAFWEIMALYALYLTWESTHQRSRYVYLLLAVLFAGMAMGTKYVSWLVFFIPFSVLLLFTLRLFKRNKLIWLIPCALIMGLIPLLPWMIFNQIWTGNLVYPLLPSIFGQHIPPAQEAYEFIRSHAPSLELVSSFSVFTLISDRIYHLMLDGNALFIVGVMALIFCPWWIRKSVGQYLPKFAAIGLTIYLIFSTLLFLLGTDNNDGRFFLSTLILLSIPSTFALYVIRDNIEDLSFVRRILLSSVIIILFTNAITYRFVQLQDLDESVIPQLTEEQRDAFILNHFPEYACIDWANEHLSSDAYVLGIGYPLRFRHISGLKYGYIPFLQDMEMPPDAKELANQLKDGGITHIIEPFPPLRPKIDLSLIKPDYLQPVFRHRRTTMYILLDPDEAKLPEKND